jgi:Ca2+/Na+ antiporter
MSHPLELSYNWRTPALFSTVGACVCLSVLIHGRVAGWVAAAFVVVLLWAIFVGVLYLRSQAYLLADGDRLTVRQYGRLRTVSANQLVAVRELLTPHGPSYRLTVRTEEGTTRRITAPVALLQGGRSTLFAWILAKAPQAELDKGSQRTIERLQSKGLL